MQRLFMFRNSMIAAELLLLTIALQGFAMHLPLLQIMAIILIYTVVNIITWLTLPASGKIHAGYMFAQLCFDVFILTCLLYYTGGTNNPFISLYLLPLLITAAMLSKPYIWSMAALTICCYALLFSIEPNVIASSSPATAHAMHMATAAKSIWNPHALGMAFSFLFSVIVLLLFVVSMAEALRQRQRKLTLAHEQSLRNDHVIALGALATGAAHELGTPLGTMAVLSKDMALENQHQPELLAQINILQSQIKRCKDTISQMSKSAGELRAIGGKRVDIVAYFQEITDNWQQQHPATKLEVKLEHDALPPQVVIDDTFSQMMINLLDNAGDASPARITLTLSFDAQSLHIQIRDFGAGLSAEVQANIGTPFFSSKNHGQGLGFYLAKVVVSRMHGDISIENHSAGGAVVFIHIPRPEMGV